MTSKRWLGIVALIAVLALVAAACGDDDDSDDTDTTSEETSDETAASDDTAESDDSMAEEGDEGEAMAVPTCLTVEDVYALVGPESQGIGNWADAQEIATELGSSTTFPDLPLEIHGPGEESGTFDTFVEFVVDPIAEERGLEDASTRPDYSSSPNDNVIVEGASATEGSFGWVGFAFYVENTDVLQAFEVDGGSGCVFPDPDTIASGDYPFSRPLFIYVNTDKAADNPAVARWVYDYLSPDGRAQVTDAGYVDLTDEAWDETVATWDAVGVADPGDGQSGSVLVSGSSTVEPISARVSENVFQPENPDAAWEVTGPGTGDGFQRFCAGETDISDASRAIKDEEAQTCADAGINYVELQIGIDGIATFTAAG